MQKNYANGLKLLSKIADGFLSQSSRLFAAPGMLEQVNESLPRMNGSLAPIKGLDWLLGLFSSPHLPTRLCPGFEKFLCLQLLC